jgi:hypothetical protein
LEEQIRQGQLTIEKSKELLKRLDEIIDRAAPPRGKCSYMVVLGEKERRALEALARHPGGCDEAVLLADGCTVGQLAGLVIDGLATMRPTHIPLDGREKLVISMKISEAGLKAITD